MVYIVILNWKNVTDTLACLESLLCLNYENYGIIICDNDSNDGSQEKIEGWIDVHINVKSIFVQTGNNIGFAGGNNIGIKIALSDPLMDYVWLLNNDTVVHPDALSHLVAKYRTSSDIGICGSTLLYALTPQVIQAVGGRYNSWLGTISHVLGGMNYSPMLCESVDEKQLDYVIGASMLVSRGFLDRIGLMAEEYFLYFEELDWAMRAKQAGFRMAYAPGSLVYHKEGGATGASARMAWRERSAFSDACALRSRLLFAAKFYPIKKWFVRISYLAVCVNRLRRGDWGGVRRVVYALCN